MADLADLRASDADREAVADILRAQCAAGRLDVSELEERLSAALAARTLGELDRLLADFPGGRSATPAPPPSRATSHRVGLPGLRRFRYMDVFHRDRATAFAEALDEVVPSMVRVGYDVVVESEPRLLVFECREYPTWVPLVCIFLFPIGLVALAFRDTQRIVVTFEEHGPDRTRVTAQGTARRPVRKAFARLGDV